MTENSTDSYDNAISDNNSSSMNYTDYDSYPDDSLFRTFNIYLIPVIIVVGVLGNVVSFVVFTATHLRRQSSSIYLAGLAVADASFLLSLFIGWFSWLDIDLFHRNVWCQVVVYVTYVSSFLSVWCVVCFTAERYVIVSYPFKRQTLCTVKKARAVLVAMFVFALSTYAFPLWTSGIIYFREQPYCFVLPQYEKALFVITTIDTFITLFSPSLIIIVLNIRIAVLVYRFSKDREALRGDQLSTGKFSDRKDRPNCACAKDSDEVCKCEATPTAFTSVIRESRPIVTLRPLVQMKITRMLLVVSTTFIVLNLPSHVVRIKSFVERFSDSVTTAQSQVERLFQSLSQFIYYTSFSINFFLYSLCGRNFRRSLYRLMLRIRYNIRKTWFYLVQVIRRSCCRRRHNAQFEQVIIRDM